MNRWCFLLTAGLIGIMFANPAMAQRLGGAETTDISLWRVAGVFVFCVLLASAAAFMLKLKGARSFLTFSQGNERLKLVETISVGTQSSISLIELDGREFLIGCSPASITVLDNGDHEFGSKS